MGMGLKITDGKIGNRSNCHIDYSVDKMLISLTIEKKQIFG